MLCVRKYSYNCAHRLDYSTSLYTQQNTNTNPNPKCKSVRYPSLSHCPENKIQALQPAYTGPSGPCQPLTSLLNGARFSNPKLLTIPLMPQAVLLLPVLPAPCPLPGMPFSEFLSGQDLLILWRCCYRFQELCILNLNCPCICLCPCPNLTLSPTIAFVPSYPWDSDSPNPGTDSHSQLCDL